MYLTAEPLAALPGIRHAFFTRGEAEPAAGGSIYQGLNCGFGSSDDAETVRANRARAMAALGLPPEALATLYQVHSARVVTLETPEDAMGQRADAMVTDRPGIALGILTADCAPLLFCDPQTGVIGAAHAGWKGARFGVAEAVLQAMERLGADRSRIRAAIGPTIGPESYETGPEFPAHFLGQATQNARFFRRPAGAARAYFDLPGYLEGQLRSLGLVHPVNLGEDTVADPQRFFSYRRSVLNKEPDYGRLLSAIVLPE
jgi:YfiH family protein